MTDVKQFIMANGDEVVCEVLEWATIDDPDMVVRRAYKIVTIDDPIRGIRYFTLRPWMLFQSGDEIYTVINTNHIVSEGNPQQHLLTQYKTAIEESESEEASRNIDSAGDINIDSSGSNVLYLGNLNKDKLH